MSRWHTTEFDLLPEQAFRPRGWKGGMTLEGGGKGGSAPAPDPNVGTAAREQIQLARDQYNDFKTDYAPFLKEQMAQGLRISNEQNEKQTVLQDYQLGRSKIMDSRWDNVQVPLEDTIIAKAKEYNEPAEQERMARLAQEDVGAAFTGAQGRIQRGLAARGIRAGSGAATAAMSGLELQRALAEASAVNKTRQAAKDIGWTKLGEAAALGRGLPGFGSTSAQLSLGAGQAAFGAGTAGVGLVSGASGAANAAAGTSGGLYTSAGNLLNTQYGNQIQGYRAQQENDPFGTLLGSAAGAAGQYGMKALIASDRRLKTDIKRIGTLDIGLPVYTYRYKIGGPVFMGVMADEVARVAPQAYVPGGAGDGFDAVDYGKLAESVDAVVEVG